MRPLKDIIATVSAATPGPWVEDDGNVFCKALVDARSAAISASLAREPHNPAHLKFDALVAKCDQCHDNFENDAMFIMHARTDVEDLCVRVQQLEVNYAAADKHVKALQLALEVACQTLALYPGGIGNAERVRAIAAKSEK